MLEGNSRDVLVVGQTPPPFHGQAVVTEMLFSHDWEKVKVECLRMSYSDTIDGVGQASLRKVFHLLYLIFATWKIVFMHRPRVLYYLPASANKLPVIRDIIYLGCVKWLFQKKVYHYHAGGLPEYLENAGLLGRVAKWIYSGADTSIEISQTEYPPAKAFRAKRQVFIVNGLDVKEIPQREAEQCSSIFKLLFVGALNEGKGVMESLKAVNTLRQLVKTDFRLQLAGAWASDEFKTECEAYVEKHELGSVVEFLGVVKGDNKWVLYASADVFLFPSHYEAENFPLVLIEAMGCGLPLITTNWRGIPELTAGSNATILCDVKDQSAIVAAIEKYIDDEDFLARSSANALEHYKKKYTKDKFVAAISEEFERLLIE